MIPFNIIHEDLLPLNIWNFNNIFEKYSYFPTFSERSINFSFLILVSLNGYLLSYKFLDVKKIFTKKILHYDSVVIKQSVNNTSFMFLFVKFHLRFWIFRDHMPNLSMKSNTTHFLLNIDIKFIPYNVIVYRQVHLFF